MSAAVIVPWRGGDPAREAAWSYVRGRLTDQQWTVVEGHAPDGPWCKAAAVADALSRTDADLLIVHDADVWCPGLDFAVNAVAAGVAWAMPHMHVLRFDEPATAELYQSGKPGAGLTEPPYPGFPGGGVTVLRRSTYEECPLDPTFVGWGQEDEAWAVALGALHGRAWRGRAPLWHLWHPPADRMNRVAGSGESWQHLGRYQAARHSPEAMRELLGKVVPCSSR